MAFIERQIVFHFWKTLSCRLGSLKRILSVLCLDFVVEHLSLSRHHCVIQFSAESEVPFLCDLGSTHGTFLNKTKLAPFEFTPTKFSFRRKVYSAWVLEMVTSLNWDIAHGFTFFTLFLRNLQVL